MYIYRCTFMSHTTYAAHTGKDHEVRKVFAEPMEKKGVQGTSSVEGGSSDDYRSYLSHEYFEHQSALPRFQPRLDICEGSRNNKPQTESTQTSEPKFYSPAPEPPQTQDTSKSTDNEVPSQPCHAPLHVVTDTLPHCEIDTLQEQFHKASRITPSTKKIVKVSSKVDPLYRKNSLVV